MIYRKVVVVAAAVVLPFVSAARAQGPDMRVMFTGYLLGYYRVPDLQRGDFLENCQPADGHDIWESASPAAQAMKDQLSQKRENSILVGMGDNFGVQLDSRIYEDAAGDLHPKSRDLLYKAPNQQSLQNEPDAIADNVGCFLSLAHYDAVVPGKDDFYFGPERLRRIARWLAARKNKAWPFRPVHLLAANLVIRTDYWKKQPAVLESEKKHNFQPGLPEGLESLDITGEPVLPFLRKLRVRLPSRREAHPEAPRLFLCDALDKNPYEIEPCSVALSRPTSSTDETSVVYTYTLDSSLKPGKSYALCVDDTSSSSHDHKAEKHCQRFSVAEPFLEDERPYVVKPLANGACAVIYGVVDPDLLALAGRSNLSWRNTADGGKYKTWVAAMDPATALRQAMQDFDAHRDEPCHAKVFRILLAQMNRGEAEELASHVGFDVVIAAAENYPQATGNQEVQLKPDPYGGESERNSIFRAFVASPWKSYFKEKSQAISPLRQLDITDAPDSRFLALSGEPSSVDVKETWKEQQVVAAYCPLADSYLAARRSTGLCKIPVDKGSIPRDEKVLVTALLEALREKTSSDIALLEKRDFYFGPFPNQAPAAGNAVGVDRVLWHGDFLQKIAVRGDALAQAMADSARYDREDKQTLKPSLETNRGLATVGIERTSDGQYLVDGVQLDPNRVYTVATSNHIMSGDTGYPELFDAALSDSRLPPPPKDGEVEHQRIASIVCEALGPWLGTQKCVQAQGLTFAGIENERPVEPPPSIHSRVQTYIHAYTRQPEFSPERRQTLESNVQLQPTWRLSLKELSWNFSAVRNNLSEVERVTALTGVSDPIAYSARGHSFDYATRAEWVRSGESLDDFVRGQLLYKVTSTGTTKTVGPDNTIVPGLANVSRQKNQVMLDVGFYWHWRDRHKNPHKYYPKRGIVLEPFHFETPLVEDEVAINAHYNPAGVLDRPAFRIPFERTRDFLGRIGYRYENSRKNSFEVGYQAGWETNALEALVFNVGSTTQECDLKAGRTLAGCLTGQPNTIDPSSIRQIRGTRERNGLYANLDWTLPLFWKMSFVALGQGQYFREAHGDNSTDTLFRNDASGTVKISIWPNFSVGPGLERIDYENKINHVHLGSWVPVLKLTYSFDQYSGGKWKKAMRFQPTGP